MTSLGLAEWKLYPVKAAAEGRSSTLRASLYAGPSWSVINLSRMDPRATGSDLMQDGPNVLTGACATSHATGQLEMFTNSLVPNESLDTCPRRGPLQPDHASIEQLLPLFVSFGNMKRHRCDSASGWMGCSHCGSLVATEGGPSPARWNRLIDRSCA